VKFVRSINKQKVFASLLVILRSKNKEDFAFFTKEKLRVSCFNISHSETKASNTNSHTCKATNLSQLL
jgi:hypothetical protein